MDAEKFDVRMMRTALAMARRGLGTTAPNPSVGAVIASPITGEIIARAVTSPGGRPHAESQALAQAGNAARGATLYVTLEPCAHQGQTPPCADQVIAADIARVVVGIQDPDPRVAGQGLARLRDAGLIVQSGVCGQEASWLTRGHVLRVTQRRPFVQLKVAMTRDGQVPRGAKGQPAWVTGDTARAHGHRLRANADAILIGGATLRDDDPELTCRLPGLEGRSPTRIIVTSQLKALPTSRLWARKADDDIWIVTASDVVKSDCARKLQTDGVHFIPIAGREAGFDARDCLTVLAEHGITRLLVEGGPQIWRWVAATGLVDEVMVFVGGCDVRGSDASQQVRKLAEAQLKYDPGPVVDSRNLGDDGLFTFRPDSPT